MRKKLSKKCFILVFCMLLFLSFIVPTFVVNADSSNVDSWQYNENYRNQYHFSANKNWINDPNGLIYDDITDTYHMYYQYNPYGNAWGNMSWGHATSKDMVNWSEQAIAIPELENQEWVDFTYKNTTGDLAAEDTIRYVGKPTTNWGDGGPNGKKYIFSGSAIMDKNNVSGLGENAILAYYTACYQVGTRKLDGAEGGLGSWIGFNEVQEQHLAYSLDGGYTFQQYSPDGNQNQPLPVVPVTELPSGNAKDFRDPKVVYDEVNNRWVMIVVAGQTAEIFVSNNLTDWQYASTINREHDYGVGVWECPELIPMTVQETGETKWVLSMSVQQGAHATGSGMQYMIGELDASGTWVPERGQTTLLNPTWLDYGEDLYAAVTFGNMPNNRKVILGWMSNWSYINEQATTPFYGQMTLPREITLHQKPGYYDGYEIKQTPVQSLSNNEQEPINIEAEGGLTLSNSTKKVTNYKGTNYKIESDFSWENENSPTAVGFQIRATDNLSNSVHVGYDLTNKKAYVNRLFTGEPNQGAPRDNMNVAVDSPTNTIKLTAYVDESSVEVFVNDGEKTITQVFYLRPELIGNVETNNIALYSYNGTSSFENATITPIRSIYGTISASTNDLKLEKDANFNPLTDIQFTNTLGNGSTQPITNVNVLENTVNTAISGNYFVKYGITNEQNKYQEETVQVTVKGSSDITPESVLLNETGIQILKTNQTLQLQAILLPQGATSTLSWSSSNPLVASVNQNGQVKTLQAGFTKISVKTENNKTATFLLRVTS